MRNRHIIHLLFFAIVLILTGCKKDEKCGYLVHFDVPKEFNEGENLSIKISNLATDPINTNYYLKPANPNDIPSQNQNGLLYQQDFEDEYFTHEIEDFSIWDEGIYQLSIHGGNDNCENKIIKKKIKMIPKESPCINSLEKNKLYVSESMGGTPIILDYTPKINGDLIDDFSLILDTPFLSQYQIMLAFYIGLPQYSSSYLIYDYFGDSQNSAEDFYNDQILACDIRLGVSGYPYNAFRPELNSHSLYFKREGDLITVSFCEVKFSSDSGESRYVSSIFELEL